MIIAAMRVEGRAPVAVSTHDYRGEDVPGAGSREWRRRVCVGAPWGSERGVYGRAAWGALDRREDDGRGAGGQGDVAGGFPPAVVVDQAELERRVDFVWLSCAIEPI